MTYDTISAIRMSEQVMAKVQDRADPYLQKIPELERLVCLKRAKALRPLFTTVGDLTGFSLHVRDGVPHRWDYFGWQELMR